MSLTTKTSFEIELPTEDVPEVSVNARTMILFGLPKSGKTTAVSELDDCLDIDIEKGSDFVKMKKLKVPPDLSPIEEGKWILAVARKIKEEGRPYKYVAIDTLTHLDEISEWLGTERYMNSTAGKSFNRYNKSDHPDRPTLWGKQIPFGSDDYESVNTLPNGYGYRWSRAELLNLYNELSDLGSVCTIFICHVADKAVISKLTNNEVVAKDLALTGKLRDILARKVDATGYLYNEDGEIMISFKGNEEKVGGNRAKHIRGYEGPLNWSKIFI